MSVPLIGNHGINIQEPPTLAIKQAFKAKLIAKMIPFHTCGGCYRGKVFLLVAMCVGLILGVFLQVVG